MSRGAQRGVSKTEVCETQWLDLEAASALLHCGQQTIELTLPLQHFESERWAEQMRAAREGWRGVR